MEGDKNDRPKWINIVFRQIAHDILVSSNPIDNLKFTPYKNLATVSSNEYL